MKPRDCIFQWSRCLKTQAWVNHRVPYFFLTDASLSFQIRVDHKEEHLPKWLSLAEFQSREGKHTYRSEHPPHKNTTRLKINLQTDDLCPKIPRSSLQWQKSGVSESETSSHRLWAEVYTKANTIKKFTSPLTEGR